MSDSPKRRAVKGLLYKQYGRPATSGEVTAYLHSHRDPRTDTREGAPAEGTGARTAVENRGTGAPSRAGNGGVEVVSPKVASGRSGTPPKEAVAHYRRAGSVFYHSSKPCSCERGADH